MPLNDSDDHRFKGYKLFLCICTSGQDKDQPVLAVIFWPSKVLIGIILFQSSGKFKDSSDFLIYTHVLTGVHHELTLDGSHPVLLMLGEQLVSGDHQGVHVADGTPGGQDAVTLLEADNLPHLLEHLVLHQDEDWGDLVSEHVGVGGRCEPLPCQGGYIQSTRQLIEESGMA